MNRKKLRIVRFIRALFLLSPLIYAVVYAYTQGCIGVSEKLVLSATVVMALILFLINIVVKNLRGVTIIGIVLLGCLYALKTMFLPLFIAMTVINIIDDLIFTPIIDRLKVRKEIEEYDKQNH